MKRYDTEIITVYGKPPVCVHNSLNLFLIVTPMWYKVLLIHDGSLNAKLVITVPQHNT